MRRTGILPGRVVLRASAFLRELRVKCCCCLLLTRQPHVEARRSGRTEHGRGATNEWMRTPKWLFLESWMEREGKVQGQTP
jgi:hypothetical protein